ncbi:MAG: TonB-dependent receptor plug [Gemmatimonadetes bacterium]|nr:TonB-dependent receptor plug [Gemmatimonadota bacterium]
MPRPAVRRPFVRSAILAFARPLAILLATRAAPAAAQEPTGTVTVLVRHDAAPVRGAAVRAEGMAAATDARGRAQLRLPAGPHRVVVQHLAFVPETVAVSVAAGRDTSVVVELREATIEEMAVVVTVTRSGTLVGDQPVRVEAVPREEIEENLTVAPGQATTLLAELAGVRIAAAAPGLGGASLRIRGMPGRHTQVLTDGLPLLGADPGAFGLLQTPPLDLARVEVVKGVASALYGGEALGGVLNLVSVPPGGDPVVLLNATSRGGRDAVGFAPARLSPSVGLTLTGAADRQRRGDPDGDGWSEVAGYSRESVRPRLFWNAAPGRTLLVAAGALTEDRDGGTLPGRTLADGTAFPESLRTRRADAGAVGRYLLHGGLLVGVRASATAEHRRRVVGPRTERDTRSTAFGEATVGSAAHGHTWVAGVAARRERLNAPDAPGVGFARTVPGAFAQDEVSPTRWLSLSASARVDRAARYGAFVSPRLSALLRPAEGWTVRASAGTGFALPTPLVDETEETGLAPLLPVAGLRAERAAGASLDASWTRGRWEVDGSLFASRVRHPLEAHAAAQPGRLLLVNAAGPLRTRGVETVGRYVAGPLHCIASYTFLDATEADAAGGRRSAALVPRHAGELAALLEDEKRGRVGVEVGYTGRRRTGFDPYRAVGQAYVEVNALAELRFGERALFVNATNLTGVRQSRWDPLVAPGPGPGGRRATDLWAPVAGRTLNVGIRAEL